MTALGPHEICEIDAEDLAQRRKNIASSRRLLKALRDAGSLQSIQLVERGCVPPLIVRCPTSSGCISSALLCAELGSEA